MIYTGLRLEGAKTIGVYDIEKASIVHVVRRKPDAEDSAFMQDVETDENLFKLLGFGPTWSGGKMKSVAMTHRGHIGSGLVQ